MQFLGSSKPQLVKANDGDRHSTRHTLLSLYSNAPSEDITLDEFERLALERLRGAKNARYLGALLATMI